MLNLSSEIDLDILKIFYPQVSVNDLDSMTSVPLVSGGHDQLGFLEVMIRSSFGAKVKAVKRDRLYLTDCADYVYRVIH